MIGRRIENLLELDYPAERLAVVVASDGSTDGTDAAVAGARRARRARPARQPAAAAARCRRRTRSSPGSRARSSPSPTPTPSGRRTPCASSSAASPTRTSATSAADLELQDADGTSREGVYWRYELWVRESESELAGITAGNGAIYAVRRERLRRERPAHGPRPRLPVHDGAARPPRGLRPGGRRVREGARADSEDEYGRRVRMHAQGWLHVLSGRMLRPAEPLFLAQIVSHRVLRYLSGSSTSRCSARAWRWPAAAASTAPPSPRSSRSSASPRRAACACRSPARRSPTTTR